MSRHIRAGSLLAVILLAGCWWALGQVHGGEVGTAFWLGIVVLAVVAWLVMDQLAGDVLGAKAVPALFGAWLLFLWEVIVVGFGVPRVLLPAPSAIGATFASHLDMLRADFVQTFVRAVIPGWIMGCGAGFIAALLIDRSPFLQRGLLPIGNLVSALPIIGVAPIMVMWFGFDWQSKAAVVVIMTFFPMLVNTTAGLAQTNAIERDLMHSYAASYVQTLLALRLPAAMPFIFNALKINATLALIGALVAEFFGTPIVGMGFRISTEVGRMNLDLVWATIAVAALAGSLSYALLAGIERMVTFWHPSYRCR
jgi:NitT/TauT family transport system permease protein